MIANEIAALKGRLDFLTKELIAAQLSENNLILNETVVKDRQGNEFLLTRVDFWEDGKNKWLYGKKKLSDGSWAKKIRVVW